MFTFMRIYTKYLTITIVPGKISVNLKMCEPHKDTHARAAGSDQPKRRT